MSSASHTFAALFPGQGSQTVGMGREIFDNFASARLVFEEASDAIGIDLKKLCFFGPESDLSLTENTQPALVANSVATFRALAEIADFEFVAGAGHSVGEYSACVAAGALSLSDAVCAVRERGKQMQLAVAVGEGAMIAVMGLSDAQIDTLCAWAKKNGPPGVLEPANYNAPGQTVLSGSSVVCDWLRAQSASGGALAECFLPQTPRLRLIPLNVSAPFHCSLMKPAQEKMSEVLAQIAFVDARWNVVQNFTAKPVRNASLLRENLVSQVSGSVRWTQSILALRDMGCAKMIEFGAGKVLSGLSKKIDSTALTTFNTSSLEELRQLEKGA